MHMPERIIPLEPAINGFDVAALLDGRLSGTDDYISKRKSCDSNKGLSPPNSAFDITFILSLFLIIIHIRLITAQKYEAPFMTTLLQGSICFVIKFI